MYYTFLAVATVLAISSATCADTFGTGDNQFEIEFVTIGDPGNPSDQITGRFGGLAGAVDYVYRIGKYEISREMIEKANAEGNLGLSMDPMDFVAGGPRPAMPATGIRWNEAARFANWLNTSQGFPPAYKFSTQPGDERYDPTNENILLWAPGDAGFNTSNLFRNKLARYVLPSVHEWHKAAYYDPNAGGGAGGYWDYPTGSDAIPTPVVNGTEPRTAVYAQESEQGPADVTQAGGLSPYGVMGLGGSVWEWEETGEDFVNANTLDVRGVRGGMWTNQLSHQTLLASQRTVISDLNILGGLRVASAPSTLPCDLNADGRLDAADASMMFANWGGSEVGDCVADGIVDAADAGQLFANWTGDGAESVPEPAFGLTTLAVLLLTIPRRRY